MLKKLLIAILPLLIVASCKKNESPVGVDVIPGSDQLNAAYAEIIPSVTYTRLDDSVMTTNVTNSNMLGSAMDPVFGRFDASIYLDYELPGGGGLGAASLGTNPGLDSIVLKLDYNTTASIPYIGDTLNPLSIDVFQLTQPLIRDSLFYSTRNIAYDASSSMIEGGTKTFQPLLRTKVRVNKDDPTLTYPQLRLRLKKELGEKLFNISYLSSVSALQSAFKGLFITTRNSILPQPSYGSVFYINMLNSRVLLYYHNDEATGPLPPIELQTGANSTRFGHFDHDYQFLAEPGLAQQLKPYYDTLSNGKQRIYLQGAGGLRAKLEFLDLLKWKDSNIVINKAQLIFTVDRSQADYFDAVKYPLPLKLFLQAGDPTTGKPTILVENIYAFGGDYNSTTNTYAFNIPHSVSAVLNGKTSNTIFYPSVYQTALFPHRVVLGGWGSTATTPVKLKLWYTRLKFPK